VLGLITAVGCLSIVIIRTKTRVSQQADKRLIYMTYPRLIGTQLNTKAPRKAPMMMLMIIYPL
jgi:hypothetical protein